MKNAICTAALLLCAALLLASCNAENVPIEKETNLPQNAETSGMIYPKEKIRDLSKEFSLAYADPLSLEYPDCYVLPDPVDYEGKFLYYASHENSDVVTQESADEQIAPQLRETLYKMDTQTGQKLEIGDCTIRGYSSGQSLLTENALFYSGMILSDSQNQESSELTIKKLDFETGENRNILTVPNALIEVPFGNTETGDVIFMVHRMQKNGDAAYQEIYKLNTDDSVQKIFTTAENIKQWNFRDFCVRDNQICLLNQPQAGGSLLTQAVFMNTEGEIESVLELPGLEAYREIFYYADRIYAQQNYIFIKRYSCGDTQPYFTAWQINAEHAEKMPIPQNAPCELLSQKSVHGRWLLFSAFPNEMNYSENQYDSHLYLFDMQSGKFTGIRLPYQNDISFGSMLCSEEGDLILYLTETNQEKPESSIIELDFSVILECLKEKNQ